MITVLILAVLLGVQTGAPANHQEVLTPDIEVNGLRPATKKELEGVKTPHDKHSFAVRRELEKSSLFVRCIHNVPAAEVRRIIDGPPNKASTRYDQGMLIAHHAGCYWNVQPPPLPPLPGDPKDLGDSPLDRGLLLEEVFAQYAPDVHLTRQDTADSTVQERFNEREVPLNKYRLPADYRSFSIAVCLVRLQPSQTVALLHVPVGSALGTSIERTLIARARECVGGARGVEFDPVLMRFYLIDALYRWVVAARGVDSLISDRPLHPH
jgi:hypothetical protein